MAAHSPEPPTSPEVSADDEELYSTRKIKPLPKRRQMIDPVMIPPPDNVGNTRRKMTLQDLSEAAEQLADALSTGMVLQSQYAPLFGAAQDLLFEDLPTSALRLNEPFAFRLPGDYNQENRGEVVDHFHQPENKKKRKIPGLLHVGDESLGNEDELTDASLSTPGGGDIFNSGASIDAASFITNVPPRAARLTRASKVAMQNKIRKLKLVAVLGPLAHGETLALDLALSGTYMPAIYPRGQGDNYLPIRPSLRSSRRKARAFLEHLQNLKATSPLGVPVTDSAVYPFTFQCNSPTSERLRATNDQVAFLRSRFEAELSRQAAKAAELAKEAAALAAKANREERSQRRLRGIAGGGRRFTDSSANDVEKATGIPSSKSKKKKRSALANASNPHHLRNYIPSRLPNSGPAHSNANVHSGLGYFPMRFLSADLTPDAGKLLTSNRLTRMVSPAEEWICVLCEYKLFYGDDEQERRRAIRNRKNILSRRRRGASRAAAASGGKKQAPTPARYNRDDDESVDDELEDAMESGPPDRPSPSKQAKLGTQQERDRDKEVHK